MKITKTEIPDLLIIEPKVFGDSRGYFFENYNEEKFFEAGITNRFVQDNESSSCYGVVRGLHYQIGEHAQAKLVRVISGTVYDVAVDLRKNSPTFGKWFGVELSGENKKQFLVPRGFAHGFSVLSEHAVFSYKCDNFYAPAAERGIAFDDEFLNIDWQVDSEKAIISEKDFQNPVFEEAEMNF